LGFSSSYIDQSRIDKNDILFIELHKFLSIFMYEHRMYETHIYEWRNKVNLIFLFKLECPIDTIEK